MKHIVSLIFYCFLLLHVVAQERTFTLQQTIDTALKNNILVKQAGVNNEIAAINLQQAKYNILPSLGGNFSYGFNQGRNVDPLTNNFINQQLYSSNVGLGTSVVLYNGLQLQNRIKQNKTNKEVAAENLQYSKDELVFKILQGYLQMLSSRELVKISASQLDVTKNQVARMAILLKEGVVGRYQYTDLQGQLANEQINKLEANKSLEVAKLNLCQLMNIEYDSTIVFVDSGNDTISKYNKSADDIYQSALQNFTLLKAGKLQVKSAEQEVKIARGAFAPTISLDGNIGSSYSSLAQKLQPTSITETATGNYVTINGVKQPVFTSQQNYNFSKSGYFNQINNNLGNFAGINISIPIFNRFQTKSNVTLARKALVNQQYEREKLQQQIRQQIEQAYLDMNTSYERWNLLQSQVTSFTESFRAATIRYENGTINSVEYLLVKGNLDKAMINLVVGKYQYLYDVKLLDYYQGDQQ